MNEEFEKKFRRMCWDMHIDESSSSIESDISRKFAEEFYKLGLEHGKSGLGRKL